MKQQQVQNLGAWIGLYRSPDNASEFYWIDDTPLLTGQYSAWAKDEPNNLYEKCVHTMNNLTDQVGKWNDRVCDLPQSSDDIWRGLVLCQNG